MKPAFPSRLLPAALLLAVLLAGCANTALIRNPTRKPMFGEAVDSVVVEPFRREPKTRTGLNEVDMQLFQELLSDEVRKRPQLRVFEEAPTELPNTLLLEGRLVTFEVEDLPGSEVFLRAIHMGVELQVRRGGTTQPVRTIRRNLSYQKIYLPSDTIPVMSFDLRDAVAELAEELVEAIYPTAVAGDLPLATGYDNTADRDVAHPLLLEGNRYATTYRYGRAQKLWRYVLFDPLQPEDKQEPRPVELFRISPRVLRLLRERGVEDGVVSALEPLTRLEPLELVDFREALRRALGGFNPQESDILTLADFREDRIHFNLAAAHRNLALLYWLYGRYDRATFHLARAWANYPLEEYRAKWAKIQRARKLIPATMTDLEALRVYMRLPPPRGMAVQPGSRETALYTPVVFEEAPAPAEQQGAAPQGEGGAQQPTDLKPVELPPPPAEGGNLPPIQEAERANRG